MFGEPRTTQRSVRIPLWPSVFPVVRAFREAEGTETRDSRLGTQDSERNFFVSKILPLSDCSP